MENFDILTAGNALKCILRQSKGAGRKNFLLASLGSLDSHLILEKFSVALVAIIRKQSCIGASY